MKKYLALFALSALVIASCAEEKLTQSVDSSSPLEEDLVEVSFEVTIDDTVVNPDGTRTSLNTNGSLVWEEGDKIGVYYYYDNTNTFKTLTLSSGSGTKTAEFKGTIDKKYKGDYCCFYPSTASTTIESRSSSATYLKVTIPDTQTYRAGNIAKGANISMATVPASSRSSSKNTYYLSDVELKNVGGILRLNIKGTKKVSKIVLADNDGFLSGSNVRLCTSFGSTPDSFSYEATSTSNSSELTLDCGTSGVQLSSSGVDFNFVVPSDRLSKGFTVTIEDTDGGTMSKTARASASNLVERSTLLVMPSFTYTPAKQFMTEIKEPGIYSDPFGELITEVSFLDGGSQCIVADGCCYVQDWAAGTSVKYQLPSSPVTGQSYSIEMTTEFGTPATCHKSLSNVKYHGKANNLLFFLSSDGSKVYAFSTNG